MEDQIAWARSEVERLTNEENRDRVSIDQAVAFLNRFAPPSFAQHADDLAQQASRQEQLGKWIRTQVSHMARLLDEWVKYAEAGLETEERFEVRVRIESATDLMEQVEALLREPGIHQAAPVVLCGAALEEFLRGMAERESIAITGDPSLDKYATALQKAGSIDKQDAKDIRAWAGRRNDAAHGHFDRVSIEQARIMADGVNLLMRQHSAPPG